MSVKQTLQKIIQDAQTKKFREGEAKGLLSEIQGELAKNLGPVLEAISREGTERMVSAFERAIKSIHIEVPDIKMPGISLPEIKMPAFPRIEVPTPVVNYKAPDIRLPDIKMPDEMNIKGWINLMGFDKGLMLNPLPVQLRDAKGNPINLLENLTRILAGSRAGGGIMTESMSAGGGRANYFTIKGFMQSAFSEIMNPDGRLKVELPTGSSGLTDVELRAAHLDVQQLSGAIDSVYVTGIANSSFSELQNGDGRLRVSIETGSSGLTNTELRAAHLDVVQMSGTIDSVYVTGVAASVYAEIMNPDGRVKVELPSGASGLTDTELRASHLDVQQVSGSTDSVNVISSVTLDVKQLSGSSDSVYVTNPFGDGEKATALRVVIAGDAGASVSVIGTTAANIVDSSGVAYSGSNPLPVDLISQEATIDVRQVSGASNSVNVIGPIAQGDSTTALRTVQAGDSVSSVYVNNPVDNGDAATALRVVIAGNSNSSVSVVGTTAANIVDSSGVAYSGSNPLPITGPVVVTSITNTTAVANVDSTGVQYSGSNPMPVTLVSGALTSMVSVGPTVADAVDDGSAPVQVGGIARTANPTPVAANDVVKSTYDDLGRQIVRPVQVRDLMVTAYATFASGTEATLLAGQAGFYLDLVYILASNNSTAAVGIDIRGSTAGSILMHLEIPANGTVGVAVPVPIPQQATGDGTGGSWTVDLPDITGTTVSVSGLFSKEV